MVSLNEVKPRCSLLCLVTWTLFVLKRLFLGIACLLVASGFGFGGLNAARYCFAEQRFLSDVELVDRVVAAAVATMPSGQMKNWSGILDSNGVAIDFTDATRRVYQSLEEFRAINPDCCQLGMHPGVLEPVSPPGWRMVVTGYAHDIVTVKYKIFYTKASDGIERVFPLGVHKMVNSCGVIKSPI